MIAVVVVMVTILMIKTIATVMMILKKNDTKLPMIIDNCDNNKDNNGRMIINFDNGNTDNQVNGNNDTDNADIHNNEHK